MTQLAGKRILLGVTGGIAAYKAAELTRLFKAADTEVRVVMTDAATAFVAPLTFQALSGNPVHKDLLDLGEEAAMGHISLARWAELIVIAPASADFMARLRAGLAGDLLSALCLAAECPIALAPAMNRAMWDNPATRENLQVIQSRGVRILGPAQGQQACGETGWGRMLEPAEIVQQLALDFAPGPLAGLKVLVSAGPTREAIDPVRFISNRSSGKMGYAVAEAARDAGAKVTLVSGPVSLEAPRGVDRVLVESAEDMRQAIFERIDGQDVYVGAAAVADYAPAAVAERKIKKNEERARLELARTRDILAEVAALTNRPFTVGFAAETDELDNYAQQKLQTKRLDMIAANLVGQAEGGFDSDLNALHVFWQGGSSRLEMASKSRIASQLVELIAQRFHAKDSA